MPRTHSPASVVAMRTMWTQRRNSRTGTICATTSNGAWTEVPDLPGTSVGVGCFSGGLGLRGRLVAVALRAEVAVALQVGAVQPQHEQHPHNKVDHDGLRFVPCRI